MTELISADDWTATVKPEVGGALASLKWRETDILRPMPEDSGDPLQAACFPLIPYCNRIRFGKFAWQKREVVLPPNLADDLHSLHGLSWQSAWNTVSIAPHMIELAHRYDGSGPWPWAYDALQTFHLSEHGADITVQVTNRANVPMPAGLGLHPYFRKRPESRVRFEAGTTILVDDGNIPTSEREAGDHFAKWSKGAALPPLQVDHCHADWRGEVVIEDDLGRITMTATGTPYLHVYAPLDDTTLCFEPVSHMPDAVNQDPGGMMALPPGCTTSMTMRIAAS
ncbi:aldose 1-epimerase [Altererythrobacter sp. ZODW24]|uniref:aldose 1-epimerase n=1 Tax=Altererythrobacter sp. ZODW24 TaxID=2185142 RepID=UPI000DF7EECE|nr:aldose 1-epimerase [Altererythrobacter sp. ZODW24]